VLLEFNVLEDILMNHKLQMLVSSCYDNEYFRRMNVQTLYKILFYIVILL
jgi:hypothetical protein